MKKNLVLLFCLVLAVRVSAQATGASDSVLHPHTVKVPLLPYYFQVVREKLVCDLFFFYPRL